MLDNYGGKPGMHGAFRNVLTGLLDVYKNAKHFKGIGITPEGTEENPASYDFYWDLVWVTPDDIPSNQSTTAYVNSYVETWVENYAKRRYGSDSNNIINAWKLLSTSVYGYKTYDGTSYSTIMTSNPRLFANSVDGGEAAYMGGYFNPLYEGRDLERAFLLLMKEFNTLKGEETYIYDICDIMLQMVCNSSGVYLEKMANAVNNKNYEEFDGYKRKFLRCMQFADEINMYIQDMMVGNWAGKRIENWVNDERTGDYSDYDIDNMKHNALILITTWSSGTQLIGYANRAYSGLISEYHYKNWEAYLTETTKNVKRGVWKSGETKPEDYFYTAWELIVSRGEGLPTEALSSDSPEFAALCTEIVKSLLMDSTPTYATIAANGKGYTVADGKLDGVSVKTTVAQLKKAVKADGNGTTTFVVVDKEGNALEDSVTVAEGMKILLLDEGDFTLDSVTVSKLSDTVLGGDEGNTGEEGNTENEGNTGNEGNTENEGGKEKDATGLSVGVVIAIVAAAMILAVGATVLVMSKKKK
jgi:hypothetical protein